MNVSENRLREVAGVAAGGARRLGGRVLPGKTVALLVDAENIPARFFPQAYERAREIGRVKVVRAYGPVNVVSSDAWAVAEAAYGVERVVCAGCKSGKNSSDIAMTVDAMELLSGRRAEAFVLVSDDSDFAPLARRLRERGRSVVGMGRLSRNKAYRSSFDDFLVMSDSQGGTKKRAQLGDVIDKAAKRTGVDSGTLTAAVKCVEQGAKGGSWCLMSMFGTLMRKECPTFSAEKYGCRNTTAFAVKTGLFEVTGAGGDARIRTRAS